MLIFVDLTASTKLPAPGLKAFISFNAVRAP